jgi:urease accessory protein
MIKLTQFARHNSDTIVDFTLELTAEERNRSHHRFTLANGEDAFLRFPRGTVFHHQDILTNETQSSWIKIIAKPESVLTVFSPTPLLLIRAAYHLGNRHVPVEITPQYLRLLPDPVLEVMLGQLGLEVKQEVISFKPELGAFSYQKDRVD